MAQAVHLSDGKTCKFSIASVFCNLFSFEQELRDSDEGEVVYNGQGDTPDREMIELMQYAIGYNKKRVKDGRFEITENSFDVIVEHPEWEYMVKSGYAIRMETFDGVFYRLSIQGLEFLSGWLGVSFA